MNNHFSKFTEFSRLYQNSNDWSAYMEPMHYSDGPTDYIELIDSIIEEFENVEILKYKEYNTVTPAFDAELYFAPYYIKIRVNSGELFRFFFEPKYSFEGIYSLNPQVLKHRF